MNLSFGNPLALWALTAIPAILAIHFLQRESRKQNTSTLFLIERIAPVSAQGRKFDRIRSSWPLWMQLLAVLLATWLMAQPRWLRSHSVQTIVTVMDSSISLRAFHQETIRSVEARWRTLEQGAATSEWLLLETDPTKPTLYSGTDLSLATDALKKWDPLTAGHDPMNALRSARQTAGKRGIVIFVTDHETPVPQGVRRYSIAKPIANSGFAGVTATRESWRALVLNLSGQEIQRGWAIDNQPQQTLSLPPGGSLALSGSFSPDTDRVMLSLSGSDGFDPDDTLPIVRPQIKPLGVKTDANPAFEDFFQRFLGTLDGRSEDRTDVALSTYRPLAPTPISGVGIVFVEDPGSPSRILPGAVTPESHPFSEGLSWSGLLVKSSMGVPIRPTDQPIVWQGERPLLFLRSGSGTRSLVVNFDIRHSNAIRIPAFVVALHRFAESVRETLPDVETINAETNQLLATGSRAPQTPGFFDQKTIRGAAHFADVQEADFRNARPLDETVGLEREQQERNSASDFLTPLWIALLAAACLIGWFKT